MIGLTLALSAGCCAALASSFAKLAMSPELWSHVMCDGALRRFLSTAQRNQFICSWVVILCRVVSFSLVFVLNALMWTLFVKSLRKCSSSAVASVTNTGSNLVCTAIIGLILFGETLSMRWWLGASFIITGLILIHHGNDTSQNTDAMQAQAKRK